MKQLAKTATLACILALGLFGADDPFTGTWKLDLSKSKLRPPAPLSASLRLEVDAGNIRITADGIDDQQKPFHVSANGAFGSTVYAVMGLTSANAASYRRVDSRTIIADVLKSGVMVENATAVVSKDARTLKITLSFADESGKEIKVLAAFEK